MSKTIARRFMIVDMYGYSMTDTLYSSLRAAKAAIARRGWQDHTLRPEPVAVRWKPAKVRGVIAS